MKTSNIILALVPALAFYACGGAGDDAPLKKSSLNLGPTGFEAYLGNIKLGQTIVKDQTDGVCLNPTIGIVFTNPALGANASDCNGSLMNQIQIVPKNDLNRMPLALTAGAPKLDPGTNTCRIEYTVMGQALPGEIYLVQIFQGATGYQNNSFEFQTDAKSKICNGGFQVVNMAGSTKPFLIPVSLESGDDTSRWDFGKFWTAAKAALGNSLTETIRSTVRAGDGRGPWTIQFSRPAKLADVQRGVSMKKKSSNAIESITVSAKNPTGAESLATEFEVRPSRELANGLYILSIQAKSAQGEFLSSPEYGEVVAFTMLNVNLNLFEFLAELLGL